MVRCSIASKKSRAQRQKPLHDDVHAPAMTDVLFHLDDHALPCDMDASCGDGPRVPDVPSTTKLSIREHDESMQNSLGVSTRCEAVYAAEDGADSHVCSSNSNRSDDQAEDDGTGSAFILPASAAAPLYRSDVCEALWFDSRMEDAANPPDLTPSHSASALYAVVSPSTDYRADGALRAQCEMAHMDTPAHVLCSSYAACHDGDEESCVGRMSRCNALDDVQQEMRPSEVKNWGGEGMRDDGHAASPHHTGSDAFFHYFETMRPLCVRMGVLPLPHTLATRAQAKMTKQSRGNRSEEHADSARSLSAAADSSPKLSSLRCTIGRTLRSYLAQMPFVERFVHPRRFFQLLDTRSGDGAAGSSHGEDAGTYQRQPIICSTPSDSINNNNNCNSFDENRDLASRTNDILGWAGVFTHVPLTVPITDGANTCSTDAESTVQVFGTASSEGQSFHRKLLSEYDTNITLENYMSYFELKSIAKSAEKLRIRLEERLRENKRKAVAPTVTATKSSNNLSDESTLKEKAPDGNSTCLDDLFTPNTQEEATKLFPTDDIIAEIYSDLRTVHQNFFHIFHVSYLRVKQYLLKMEERLTASMNELRHHSDMVLREISPDYIPSLYAQVQSIVSYRTLNLYAFRKIMRKFLERCACDSIVLQRRIFVLDAMIDESSVAHPTVDLRGVALELIAIYGTVFKHSYEETVMKLQYYDHRTSARDPRLLATSDTFFFANTLPQQELPGTFMVRVIAGSGSTLAEKMLTEVLQCPQRSTAACHRFPNGEVFVKLLRAVRGDDVFVVQSMAASPRGDFSTSDVIVELSLLIQCVKLAGAARVTAVVPYLAYTRNVASIAVLAEVIETMGCNHVVTVDMHSDQVEGMFTIPLENVSAKYELIRYLSKCLKNEGHDFSNITIVAPSGDYLGRAKEFADALMRFNNLAADTQFVSVCTAAKRFQPSMWNANSSYSNVHSTTTNNNNNNNSSSHNDTNRFRNAQDDKAAATAAAAAVSVNAHEGSALVQATASDTVSSWQSPTVAGLSSLSLHAELKQGADSSPTNTAGLTESAHADKKKHNGSVLSARPATSEAVHVQTKPTKEDTSSLLASPRTLGTPIIPRAHDITPSTSLRQPSLMLTEPSQHSTTSGSNLGSPLAMASKTLGMEKALRKQAAGREAVLQQIISTVEDEGNDIVIVGEAHNRLCIILDTMIGEAENLSAVVRALRAYGAQRIFLVSTHAVLCGRARELLIELPIELIIVTDTVNLDHEMYDPRLARKLRVVPIAPLLALAIEKIHTENTLSTLFEK